MTYLYAAYVATWAIHIAYLTHIVRRYSRLRKQVEQMQGKS